MTPLTANLKHFYQSRAAMFWLGLYIVFTLFFLGFLYFYSLKIDSFLLHYFFSVSIICIIITSLQREVLSKPFAFCLPGQRQLSRHILFLVCFLTCLLSSCLLLLCPAFPLQETMILIASSTAFGMAISCCYINVAFQLKNTIYLILIPCFSPSLFNLTGIFTFMEKIVVTYPIGNILAALALGMATWKRLDSRHLARKDCGKRVMGISDQWNRQKQEKFKVELLAGKKARHTGIGEKQLEIFFIDRMIQANPQATKRHLWGNLYALTGKHWNLNSFYIFMSFFFGTVVCGYFSPGTGYMPVNISQPINTALFLFIPVMISMNIPIDISSSLLLPSGRRERLRSGLVTSLLYCGLTTVMVWAAARVTIILKPFMPEMHIREATLTFMAADITYFILPFTVMPFLMAYQLLIPQKAHLLKNLPFILIIPIVLILPNVLSSHLEPEIRAAKTVIDIMNPYWVIAAVIAGWLAFTTACHFVCYRKDMVS